MLNYLLPINVQPKQEKFEKLWNKYVNREKIGEWRRRGQGEEIEEWNRRIKVDCFDRFRMSDGEEDEISKKKGKRRRARSFGVMLWSAELLGFDSPCKVIDFMIHHHINVAKKERKRTQLIWFVAITEGEKTDHVSFFFNFAASIHNHSWESMKETSIGRKRCRGEANRGGFVVEGGRTEEMGPGQTGRCWSHTNKNFMSTGHVTRTCAMYVHTVYIRLSVCSISNNLLVIFFFFFQIMKLYNIFSP